MRGAAAVEFALVFPLLLIMLFAIIDFGWIFNQQLTLTEAAREGARYNAIHSIEAGAQTDGEARADAIGSLHGVAVTVTRVERRRVRRRCRVTVAHTP